MVIIMAADDVTITWTLVSRNSWQQWAFMLQQILY